MQGSTTYAPQQVLDNLATNPLLRFRPTLKYRHRKWIQNLSSDPGESPDMLDTPNLVRKNMWSHSLDGSSAEFCHLTLLHVGPLLGLSAAYLTELLADSMLHTDVTKNTSPGFLMTQCSRLLYHSPYTKGVITFSAAWTKDDGVFPRIARKGKKNMRNAKPHEKQTTSAEVKGKKIEINLKTH